jgi:VCBS repeat-containing protein
MESLESRQLLSAAPVLPGAWDLGFEGRLSTSCFVADSWERFAGTNDEGVSGSSDVEIAGPASNSAPVARDDAYAIRGNQQIGSNVLANDNDLDGDSLTVALVSGASHGRLLIAPDGRFTYAPEPGFDGEDSFIYRTNDGQADSDPATVRIQVSPAVNANAAPAAANDHFAISEDEVLVIDADGVLANDSDIDGDPLSALLATPPRYGTLILGTDGSLEYTPGPDFHGTDSFTYIADDGESLSVEATVTIDVTPVNDAPVAGEDAYTIDEDAVLSVGENGVLGNDSDLDGNTLAATLVAGPSHGLLILNPDGTFEYTPEADFAGTDTFQYAASDGEAQSAPATVTISVAAVNDAPVAADDAYTVNTGETLTVAEDGLLNNDGDAEQDPLTAILVDGPSHGSVTLNPDGSFEYTPDTSYRGGDSFTYVAHDGTAGSNLATVTITVESPAPENTPPVARDDRYRLTSGDVLSVKEDGVLANDSDPDGDPLSAAVVEGPTHGTLTLAEDGSFQYAPEEGFRGIDRFTYVARDGQSESEPATVVISVEQTTMRIHLKVSDSAFGPAVGPIWGGSTFWVNAYVEDLRESPQGVVGGAVDLLFDTLALAPTGNVAYGEAFSVFQQGTADDAAGLVDEAGALTTTGGVGVGGAAPFAAWEFRRDGAGAPDDANSHVVFSVAPAQGDGTILPSNFALVGQGTGVDWSTVELGTAQVDLFLGDFNADGYVNHFDLALWIPQNSTTAGDPAYSGKYDLNADATVDQLDLDLLLSRMYEPVMPETLQDAGDSGEAVDNDLHWADSLAAGSSAQEGLDPEFKRVDLAFGGQEFWRNA